MKHRAYCFVGAWPVKAEAIVVDDVLHNLLVRRSGHKQLAASQEGS